MSQPAGAAQLPEASQAGIRPMDAAQPPDHLAAGRAPGAVDHRASPSGEPSWAHVRPTNAKAIVAVSLLWVAPAAIVFGVLARKEIRRTGEAGWGLATWALGLGIASVALYVLYIVAFIGLYAAILAGALAAGSATGF